MSRQTEDSLEGIEYTAYPFHVIDFPSGVILRRGNTRILLEGDDAIPTILIVLKATSGAKANKRTIIDLFPSFRKDEIESLLDELIDKRFLVDVDLIDGLDVLNESNSDVFFWQLNKKPSEMDHLFKEKKVFIFGQNKLSSILKNSVLDIGFKNVEIVPYKSLNSFPKTKEELLRQEGTFQEWSLKNQHLENSIIIAACEFGGQFLLLELNEYCIKNNLHFIPVAIENTKAQVGPLVIPYQTACIQCLRSRQNAHLHNIDLERYTEQYAHEGQEVAASHLSIIKSAAEVAAFELIRAFGNFTPNYQPTLIEISLLQAEMSSNVVLKIPRCEVCSSETIHPSIVSLKPSP